MIAEAMPRFGLILVDDGDGFSLFAQNPNSVAPGAYEGLLPLEDYPPLAGIPLHRLKVLRLGRQSPHKQISLPPLGGCANFS